LLKTAERRFAKPMLGRKRTKSKLKKDVFVMRKHSMRSVRSSHRSEGRGTPSKRRSWHSFSDRYEAYQLHAAAPISVFIILDSLVAGRIKQHPQYAAGILRAVLSAVEQSTDFSKSTRSLTEQQAIQYYGDSRQAALPAVPKPKVS